MDLEIKDQVVLITGSSRGIGLGIAEVLSNEGARLVITGRDKQSLEGAYRRLSQINPLLLKFSLDLTEAQQASELINQIIKTWNQMDCLILNVGSGQSQTGWDIPHAEWQRMFDLNLFSAVHCVRASVPYLSKSKNASIIFISSIAGIEALPAPFPYVTAKAAIQALSKNLSRELAPLGIRVNTVAPGNIFFEGGTWDQKMKQDRNRVEQMLKSEVPLNRFGTPREVGDLVAFLASPRAAFITGASFIIDGGQTKTL